MSLAQKAARGAAWTILFGLGARGIGVAGTLVMTHLVHPEVIGEVGAAVIVVMAFNWITNWGFGQYLVVKGRGDEEAEVTWHCTVAQTTMAAVSAGLVILLGPLVMPWFSVASAAAFIPLTALAFGLRRVLANPEKILVRQMKFRAIGVSMAAGELTYAIISVILAYQGHGGMSVVWGNLAQSVVVGAVLIGAAGIRSWTTPTRLRLERFRQMAKFGLPLGIESVAHNAARYCDNLLMARYFGASQMALYNMGYNLADIPAVYVGEQIGQVLLPSLAAMPPERRPPALERSTAMLALIIFPMAIGLGAIAPTLIAALLSAQWQGVAPLLTLLSVMAVFRPITWTLSTYLEVGERTTAFMYLEVAKLVLLLGGIAVLQRWGIQVAACAVGVAYGFNAIAGIWLVAGGPKPAPSARRLVSGFARPLLACAVMAVAVLGTRAGLREIGLDDPRLRLPIELVVGGLVYVAAAFVVARGIAHDLLSQLKHLRRGRPAAAAD